MLPAGPLALAVHGGLYDELPETYVALDVGSKRTAFARARLRGSPTSPTRPSIPIPPTGGPRSTGRSRMEEAGLKTRLRSGSLRSPAPSV